MRPTATAREAGRYQHVRARAGVAALDETRRCGTQYRAGPLPVAVIPRARGMATDGRCAADHRRRLSSREHGARAGGRPAGRTQPRPVLLAALHHQRRANPGPDRLPPQLQPLPLPRRTQRTLAHPPCEQRCGQYSGIGATRCFPSCTGAKSGDDWPRWSRVGHASAVRGVFGLHIARSEWVLRKTAKAATPHRRGLGRLPRSRSAAPYPTQRRSREFRYTRGSPTVCCDLYKPWTRHPRST